MSRKNSMPACLATLALLALATVAPSRTEAGLFWQGMFGTCGSGPGQFQALWGIGASGNGTVYVADEAAQRVSRFNAAGEFWNSWAVPGAFDVAVGPDGSVAVLCRATARVERFDAGGAPLGGFGAPGAGDGQFSDPYGIAIDGLGNIYVADTGNDRIQRFTAQGVFLDKWGHGGGQAGEFGFVTEVAVDNAGNVFVADAGNGRIHRFSTAGALLGWWYLGGPGHTPMTINYGLAAAANGHVFVVDADRAIDEYTTTGQWVSRIGSYGSGPGQFEFALTLAADGLGGLYASDRTLCRIQKFGPEPPVATTPVSWGRVKAAYR